MSTVTVREGRAIPAKQVQALFAALGHGQDVAHLVDRLSDLASNSTFVVSAWDGAQLVGLTRVLSDDVLLSVLQPVGVHPAYRGQGLGRALIQRCLNRFGHTTILVLVESPPEAAFYQHVGFLPTNTALVRPRQTTTPPTTQ